MRKNKILVLEDERDNRELLSRFLEGKGFEVLPAENCSAGERIWNQQRPDAAVLDYSLPDGNSLKLLTCWKIADPLIPIIILTGHASIDVAVQAIKLGAEQFLTKPVDLMGLHVLLQRALENQRNRTGKAIERERRNRNRLDPFLGNSAAIRKLAELSRKVLSTESPILITGETGTGKGVLAHWIHETGSRAGEAFVDLNCGGLSRELLESELFGHEKGAFTGAVNSKPGLLELAHRGTVFLDEIGDLELQIQPRLLKVLEDHKFRRLGDVRDRSVDLRLIAATHHDLLKAVQEKKFRSDFYFRISAIPLSTPPLRTRVEDIPLLADWVLSHMSLEFGERTIQITNAAMNALKSYSWPGNIRELRNVLERAVLLSEGKPILTKDLHFIEHPEMDREKGVHIKTLQETERDYIEEILIQEDWNVEQASKILGIPRSSLYHKIKQWGLSRPRPKVENPGFQSEIQF
jgi:DNA-binding NtrC family response regulator